MGRREYKQNLANMDGVARQLLASEGATSWKGDVVGPFFGFMGASSALVFACFGAAYGTAKSGVGIASMGVMRPELVMKSIVPVVMAGGLGIYGLIIAVIISTGINQTADKPYYLFDGYAHLAAGLDLLPVWPLESSEMLVSGPMLSSPSCSSE